MKFFLSKEVKVVADWIVVWWESPFSITLTPLLLTSTFWYFQLSFQRWRLCVSKTKRLVAAPPLRHGKCSEVDSNALGKDCARLEDTKNNNSEKKKDLTSSPAPFGASAPPPPSFLPASPCLRAHWKPVGLVGAARSRGGREKKNLRWISVAFSWFPFVHWISNHRMIQQKHCLLSQVLGTFYVLSWCVLLYFHSKSPAFYSSEFRFTICRKHWPGNLVSS